MKKTLLTLATLAALSTPVVANELYPNYPTWGGDNVTEGENTPNRPMPDFGETPDWGNGVERPIPDLDETPDRGQPDSVEPDRGQPDETTPDRNPPVWGGDNVEVPVTDPEGGADLPQLTPDFGKDINDLRADFEAMAAHNEREFARLDGRVDQANALMQATVNARPMVESGQTAFGFGVGFAGTQAISAGIAHNFDNSGWSVSGTVSHVGSHKGAKRDTSAGAGVQFAF